MDAPSRLRALIVDAERLAREELRHLLTAHPDIHIVGEADSVPKAATLVDDLKPDVVFLDVQMRGETGFDLFGQVENPFHVIFVTGFDQYAIRAFEVNARDYLLKPVRPDRLAEAVQRIHKGAPRPAQTSGQLAYDDVLFLDFGSRSRFVHIRDFVFIRAAGDYSKVMTAQGREALVLSSLKQWEGRLPEEQFVRIHRSTIVNLEHVREVQASVNNASNVFVVGQEEPLRMSRRYASRIRERMS